MTITQTGSMLELTSPVVTDYAYVHYYLNVNSSDVVTDSAQVTDSFSYLDLTEDSYYQLVEILLPTTPGTGYYISGQSIYDPDDVMITTDELLAIYPTTGTNIVRTQYDWISTYFLNEYYINLLKSKYLKNICSCNCFSKTDKVLIDALTMGFILIDALKLASQYYEANRIIDQLAVCTNTVTGTPCNCYE